MNRQLVLTTHFRERVAERAIPSLVLSEVLTNHRRVQCRKDPRVTLLVGGKATIACRIYKQEMTLLTAYWEGETA